MGRPKPFPQGKAATRFLRVATVDWGAVTQGLKTELRMQGRYAILANSIECPVPVVAYSFQRFKSEARSCLLVIEEAWSEPLGAISPESLDREGFECLKDFRHYWRAHRTRQGFKPLATVQVYRLRPFLPADRRELADVIFERLYGRWLDGPAT